MAEYFISSTKFTIQERQTKKHGKVYDVVFRLVTLEGVEKQKKLSGYATKTLAKEAYAEFVTEHCELVKNNPIKKKDPAKKQLYVKDLIAEYIISMKNQCKDSTIYDRKLSFDKFVLPYYQNSTISDLTKQELYQWQDRLWQMKNPKTGDFYAYEYLSKNRTCFSSFLTWCSLRYDTVNYFSQIPKPKRRAPKTKMQIWTREEFDKFISVVDDPMYHCLFTALFFTGRRKGELFALTPDDITPDSINFDKSITRKSLDKSASYTVTSTKAEKTAKIPLCGILKEEFKNYKGQSPFFFGGEKPLAAETVRRYFHKYIEIAGVKQIRIHDLRHSYVSMLIHLGANLSVIADLISDTLQQVTETYAHMYETDKIAIIEMIK